MGQRVVSGEELCRSLSRSGPLEALFRRGQAPAAGEANSARTFSCWAPRKGPRAEALTTPLVSPVSRLPPPAAKTALQDKWLVAPPRPPALPPTASTLTFARKLRTALQQLAAERKLQLMDVGQGQLLITQGQRCPFVFAVCRGKLVYGSTRDGDVAVSGAVQLGQCAGSLSIFSESFSELDPAKLAKLCFGSARVPAGVRAPP